MIYWKVVKRVQAYLVSLHFALLSFTDTTFFTN